MGGRRCGDGTGDGRFTRRRMLAATGAGVGSAVLAGCLGVLGGDPDPVAGAEPLGDPVDPYGVTWDDLGDLEGELVIYSGRTADQIDLVFDQLEDEYDDLDIAREYGESNDAVVSTLQEEGDATPAQVFYSQDPGALEAVTEEGLTQELPEDVIDAVPSSYRHPDGQWTGVSGRVRSIMYNSDRLDETPLDSWEDLPTDIESLATDDSFEGIISTRPNSGTFRGFIQAMVQRKGESATRDWVRDFMDQDPTLVSSGSQQAEDIERGGPDDPIFGLGNSYYAARLINRDPDSPISVTFTEGDAGALFSVAGVAVTETAEDPELVAEFVRHLLAVEGQEFMIEDNGEFPVVEGVDYVGELPGPDELNSPDFDLSAFDMELQEARDLLMDEGMLPV